MEIGEKKKKKVENFEQARVPGFVWIGRSVFGQARVPGSVLVWKNFGLRPVSREWWIGLEFG